jgi:hypothetical protein
MSSLVSRNPRVGFAIVNVLLVSFGTWCYLARIRTRRGSARVWAWFWTVLEDANGSGHLLLSAASAGYVPGVATASLLLDLSAALGTTLQTDEPEDVSPRDVSAP